MTDPRPLIPRRLLFGPPDRANPVLSPDGTQIAFLAPVAGVAAVHVGPPGGPYVPVTSSASHVETFHWCADSRRLLYESDREGDENWHLHIADTATAHATDLTPFDGVQAILVALSPECPDDALVALNKDDPSRHDVYRLNLSTGALKLEARDEGFGTIGGTWLADQHLAVRAALRPTPEGGVDVMVRDGAGWTAVLRGGLDDDLATRLLGIGRDDGAIYLATSAVAGGSADTAALCRMHPHSGTLTVVYRDDIYDIGSVLLDRGSGAPRAVTVEGAQPFQHPIDDSIASVLADVAEAVGVDSGLEVIGSDCGAIRHIVRIVHPSRPTVWYLHNDGAPPGERVRRLFADRPHIAGYAIAERRAFEVSARDGLMLPCYLTVPVDGQGPRPMVLLVHGGPWSRDHWRLDVDAAWLADRGYLVLQVNFRGSTGYGARFVAAGDRQWGAAMHDDLLDAVDHAVRAGWADPARIAIMGGSYGGYAALVGATRSQDVFACAVDLCGPSDLRTLLAGIPPYWSSLRSLWTARVGDPQRDAALLAERSPLTRAHDIRIPLLVAQGVNDPRVPLRESEQLVTALAAMGIDHEYLRLPGGHLTFDLEDELRLTAAVEGFLARHLGGRCEPLSGSALDSANGNDFQ